MGSLIIMILIPLIFIPIVNKEMFLPFDYPAHITFAKNIFENRVINIPHFLYQFSIIVAHLIFKSDWEKSGVIAVLFFYIILGLIIFKVFSSEIKTTSIKTTLLLVFLTLGSILITPITLIAFLDHKQYLGYIGINVYHNPTIILLKPFSLLLYLFTIKYFLENKTVTKKELPIIIMITILCIIAKPSYIICYLPVLGLWTLYKYLHKEKINWIFILSVLITSILILMWQYYITYSTQSSSGIVFAPFVVLSHYSSYIFIKFLLSITFPIVVYAVYFKDTSRNLSLNFSWSVFFFGILYTYLLAESGVRFFHGNFTWSGQIALFLLFISSIVFLLKQKIDNKFKFSITVLSLHLISGIVFYYYIIIS